ncbi:MAG: hypothetical protein GY781_07510 [Gammaproteobacteria bacterium]|nr:hypothetical protein [Gammaproteobacteria bacterium]
METHQLKTSLLSAKRTIAVLANHYKIKTPSFKFIGNINIPSHNKRFVGMLRSFLATHPTSGRYVK